MIATRFQLTDANKNLIAKMKPNFGYNGYGELVYYKSYSRIIIDPTHPRYGKNEQWHDTCIRVINGIMSIRKDHCIKNNYPWDESKYQDIAGSMLVSLFRMEWLPPGRGLWAMGTDMMYNRGGMCLYNCAYTSIKDSSWVEDLCWGMDCLMHGVGVGFSNDLTTLKLTPPVTEYPYTIPDSREGWVESVRRLLHGFQTGHSPRFDYSIIREAGSPIRGFGGTASGPGPLMELHKAIESSCYSYLNKEISLLRFGIDLANLVGVCVVAGNLRRSAEIVLNGFDDEFLSLKDYSKHPDRMNYGWMSNNSVRLNSDEDFSKLSVISASVQLNGEPGYINLRNFKHGRLNGEDCIIDRATGINPCGEIPLEDKEVCNLADTLPTRCTDVGNWLKACEYATFYSSTVALLPTHSKETNLVIARNRRIGIGIIDYIGWKAEVGLHNVISHLREGYKVVREVNRKLAQEAGVPESIRVTTVKPGGTTTKIAGRRSGAGHSTFTYIIRRTRVQKGTSFDKVLLKSGLKHEDCVNQPEYTRIYEYPVYTGNERPAQEVSIWEQAFNLITLQREWSDNAVSNTLYFSEQEKQVLEYVISALAPHTKSISLLPHDNSFYKQMPEECITKTQYEKLVANIPLIDWSELNEDSQDEKYCTGETCSTVRTGV